MHELLQGEEPEVTDGVPDSGWGPCSFCGDVNSTPVVPISGQFICKRCVDEILERAADTDESVVRTQLSGGECVACGASFEPERTRARPRRKRRSLLQAIISVTTHRQERLVSYRGKYICEKCLALCANMMPD
jgi:hypothetical protein